MSSRQRSSTHTRKQIPHYVGEWTDLINKHGTYKGIDFTNVDHMNRNISRGGNIQMKTDSRIKRKIQSTLLSEDQINVFQ